MDGAEHSQIRRVQQQFRKAREYASEFEEQLQRSITSIRD